MIKRFMRMVKEVDAIIVSDHARGVFSKAVRRAAVQRAKERKYRSYSEADSG